MENEKLPEWEVIYSSPLLHKVRIVKGVLEENSIQSFEINKQDSAYTFIGDIELYVNQQDAVLARFIIKTHAL